MRLETGQDIDLRYIDISWRGCSGDGDDQQSAHPSLLLGPRALALEICAEAHISMEYTALYNGGASRRQISVEARCHLLSLPAVAGVARQESSFSADLNVALPSRQLEAL